MKCGTDAQDNPGRCRLAAMQASGNVFFMLWWSTTDGEERPHTLSPEVLGFLHVLESAPSVDQRGGRAHAYL